MEDSKHPFDGMEIISSYSRAQALEDGVLIDISVLAREAGLKFPVAVTMAVFSVLAPFYGQGQSFRSCSMRSGAGRVGSASTSRRYS
jgi:hypothetical protein